MKKLMTILLISMLCVAFVATFTTKEVGAEGKETWIDKEYVDICEDVGKHYHVSPELLEAIIETESSGEQYANNGECKGLCQIYADVHGVRMARLGITDIYDPKSNIKLAADILAECYKAYGDDTMMVLMLYNGTAHAKQRAEGGDFSDYARKVSKRAYELEGVHNKHNYSKYCRNPWILEQRFKED